MSRINSLFLLIVVVAAIHMVEQILFGVEEFHMIRGLVADYHALFPADFADRASVILITTAGTTLSLLCWAAACGGPARRIAIGIFAVIGVHEIHHVFEAIAERGYDPGLVTSFAYAGVGALLLREVLRRDAAPARDLGGLAPAKG